MGWTLTVTIALYGLGLLHSIFGFCQKRDVFVRLALGMVGCGFAFHSLSLVVLKLLSGTDGLKAFETGQLHALARLAISVQGLGMNVGFILLGLGSAVFACLLLKSRYVPKALAAWGIFASLALTTGTLTLLVFPGFGAVGMAYMIPMGLYEVGLGLWLLVKGISAPPPVADLTALAPSRAQP